MQPLAPSDERSVWARMVWYSHRSSFILSSSEWVEGSRTTLKYLISILKPLRKYSPIVFSISARLMRPWVSVATSTSEWEPTWKWKLIGSHANFKVLSKYLLDPWGNWQCGKTPRPDSKSHGLVRPNKYLINAPKKKKKINKKHLSDTYCVIGGRVTFPLGTSSRWIFQEAIHFEESCWGPLAHNANIVTLKVTSNAAFLDHDNANIYMYKYIWYVSIRNIPWQNQLGNVSPLWV